MAAQVYTFKITYEGFEDKIWRIAAISSNNTLAQLGYMVLATFDTTASHLFDMRCKGTTYLLTGEDIDDMLDFGETDCDLMELHKLGALGLAIGDVIEMTYDPGCGHVFRIELLEVAPMQRGHGTSYPRILDGAGRGIVDDMPPCALAEVIRRTDETGHSGVFYSGSGCSNPPEWDYRRYLLDCDNALLKGEIAGIRECYELYDE